MMNKEIVKSCFVIKDQIIKKKLQIFSFIKKQLMKLKRRW